MSAASRRTSLVPAGDRSRGACRGDLDIDHNVQGAVAASDARLSAHLADRVNRPVEQPLHLKPRQPVRLVGGSDKLGDEMGSEAHRHLCPADVLALCKLQEEAEPEAVLLIVPAVVCFQRAVCDRCRWVLAVLGHGCLDGVFFR